MAGIMISISATGQNTAGGPADLGNTSNPIRVNAPVETAPTRLDQYIQEAFGANQGLQQQAFQLDRSLAALDEAKSLFLPNVSLQGSYNAAGGGRAVEIPVGDMLNGVYATLNQLTSSHAFPHVENQSFLLNPNNFYDAHLHTTLPLVNAELYYNRKIKQASISGQQAAVNVYKRELVNHIKAAYFQYYQSQQAIAIYEAALDLVKENIRVNQSMLNNGVRNSTALTRSLSEQERTLAEQRQAMNNALNAKAYFNFLLNRPGSDTIELDTSFFFKPEAFDTSGAGVTNREELTQWRSMETVNGLNLRMEKSYLIPQLNTFLDLGSQGEGVIDNKTTYYFFGVTLSWNIFAGGQHTYRAREANADLQSAQAGYEETARELQLELEQAYHNYNTAVDLYHSAEAQLHFAQKYFTDQSKAYREGQLLYVELLDAQNQLTNTRLQLAQAYAGVQIARAQLERDQATYPINKKS
jgi:outer membrane protein TolC